MTPVVSSTHFCYVAPLRLLFYDLCGVCDVASVGHWFTTFLTNIVPPYSSIQVLYIYISVAYPGFLFSGWGVQQIHLRTEERENRDLGV